MGGKEGEISNDSKHVLPWSVQMVKKNMLCLNAPSRDEDSRESHVSVRAKRDAKPHDASRSYTIGSKAVRNYAAVIEIGPKPPQKSQIFQIFYFTTQLLF